MPGKRICVLTSMPESTHGQRILDGILTQCRKYRYQVAVFATMTNLMHSDRAYQRGEEIIYQLPDFDFFDGVIMDTVTFGGGGTVEALHKILPRLQEKCRAPVVSLELPLADYQVIENDNEGILREMCRHLVRIHGKRDICILTAAKDNPVGAYRLSVFLDELNRLGITVPEERIVYGDFWYTSGEKLADEIKNGTRTMPEAFLCASDHMALGLIERLKMHGYSIPQDTIVVGFDGTQEAALNDTPLTSFVPNDALTAAKAVDHLRTVLEPELPVIPFSAEERNCVHIGGSCGCEPDLMRSVAAFRASLYYTMRNYNLEMRRDDIDIGLLMENYVSEKFTGVRTPQECLEQICYSSYLLLPMQNHFLCLADDWLTDHTPGKDEFPPQMRLICAYSECGGAVFCGGEQSILFDTAQMLPQMQDESSQSSVFYFSPVHFGDKIFGYSVLQRSIDDTHKISLVYRNWLRLVNNSLEMMRAKSRYVTLSSHDEMTGLLNRRGFYEKLKALTDDVTASGKALILLSVDLDGLKSINDTYGHIEGDTAITTGGKALAAASGKNAVCARFGGDEFAAAMLLPVAETALWYKQFREKFYAFLDDFNAHSGKPYQVKASVGFASHELEPDNDLESLIKEADARMYAAKTARKAARK